MTEGPLVGCPVSTPSVRAEGSLRAYELKSKFGCNAATAGKRYSSYGKRKAICFQVTGT